MLPGPATAHADWHRRQELKFTPSWSRDSLSTSLHRRSGRTRWRRRADALFARARLTNLAVLILIFVATCSLFLNLAQYLTLHSPLWTPSSSGHVFRAHGPHYSGAASSTPARSSATRIIRPPSHTNLTHLVLVPCHSIFLGTSASDVASESNWVLAPFQRGRGRTRSFWRHIVEGARRALEDERALLVFSGYVSPRYMAGNRMKANTDAGGRRVRRRV
jgi:hypothetical protein